MDYTQALEYLYTREQFGKLGLERIQELMHALDDPHKGQNFIHVAGTNGKGSTSAMVEAVLSQNYKVGLYTSPHLTRFTERIKINDTEITEEEVVQLLEKIKPHVKDHSYFEIVTAMAFLYFKEQNCDWVVLEVGLGGRFDATNIVEPRACIITDIDIDHAEQLGKTVEKVAFEKAGIIKPTVPVFVLDDNAGLDVFDRITMQRNAPLILVHPDHYLTSLEGDFQQRNASLAAACIKTVAPELESTVEDGLRKAYWPARNEKVGNIVIDSAHNPAGLKAILSETKKRDYKQLIVIFAMMHDKDYLQSINLIKPYADNVIVTKVRLPRCLNPNLIAQHVPNAVVTRTTSEALKKAQELAKEDDLILVCGSIFLAGEIRPLVVKDHLEQK